MISFKRKKGSITTETIVKIIIALGFLITGVLLAVLLRGRSESISEQIKNVFSFGFID